MKKGQVIAIAFSVLLLTPWIYAGMLVSGGFKIDFTDPTDAAKKATWSDPDNIAISGGGLGWDGSANASRGGWLQTTPHPIGTSWRPARHVALTVKMKPVMKEIELPSGQTTTPRIGDLYVRYSPDRKHWSTWQVMERGAPRQPEGKEEPFYAFNGTLSVPLVQQEAYNKRLREYAELDVPWKSDEEAAVRWILEREPDFFSKHLPFIGYVQFRYEGSFYGGQRIQSFDVLNITGMGGLHHPPRDESTRDGRRGPWRFAAEEETEAREDGTEETDAE